MRQELADFLDFCRLERRLAPVTCSAYERDVGACLAFLQREGSTTLPRRGPPIFAASSPMSRRFPLTLDTIV